MNFEHVCHLHSAIMRHDGGSYFGHHQYTVCYINASRWKYKLLKISLQTLMFSYWRHFHVIKGCGLHAFHLHWTAPSDYLSGSSICLDLPFQAFSQFSFDSRRKMSPVWLLDTLMWFSYQSKMQHFGISRK